MGQRIRDGGRRDGANALTSTSWESTCSARSTSRRELASAASRPPGVSHQSLAGGTAGLFWSPVFRSRRRPVIFPQADHARFSAVIALAWGNDRFPRPPLPFDAFIRGVALHDRGYGELDNDPLLETPRPRWIEIQRNGFRPRGVDPVVDLVVGLHVRRLVGPDPAGEEMAAALPALHAAAGVSEADALAADAITALCDGVAFDFCFEEPESGTAGGVHYRVDGCGGVTLDPWPLSVPRVVGIVTAYEEEGYPARLEPVVVPFSIAPG
jgi:hypothetical protein